MAWSDARDSRDRAGRAGGMDSSGGRRGEGPPHAGPGGGAVAGLGNPGGFGGRNNRDNPQDTRFSNPRYSQNMGVARPATVGNISTALSMTPGPGLALKAGRMIAGWDPYTGPQAPRTNFSYDSPNRMRRSALAGALRNSGRL